MRQVASLAWALPTTLQKLQQELLLCTPTLSSTILTILEHPSTSFPDEPWELTSSFTSNPQAEETAHLGQTEKNRGPAHLDSGRV